MPTVTTTELVDRAKAAADMRDNFVTPTQWMYWATQERQALDLFLARSGWPQQFATTDVTVVGNESGVSAFSIPATTGIMAIVCVHQVQNGKYRKLRHQNVVDYNPDETVRGNSQEYRVYWAGDGLYLNLYPWPQAGEVYRVTYLPHPYRLVITDDIPPTNSVVNVAYPLGWEERIVLGMARRALIKEESDTRAIDQEIALWDARIEEACWSRVLAEAPSVRNVDSEVYGWTDRYTLPPFATWTFV